MESKCQRGIELMTNRLRMRLTNLYTTALEFMVNDHRIKASNFYAIRIFNKQVLGYRARVTLPGVMKSGQSERTTIDQGEMSR
jgi:hypothetical protein